MALVRLTGRINRFTLNTQTLQVSTAPRLQASPQKAQPLKPRLIPTLGLPLFVSSTGRALPTAQRPRSANRLAKTASTMLSAARSRVSGLGRLITIAPSRSTSLAWLPDPIKLSTRPLFPRSLRPPRLRHPRQRQRSVRRSSPASAPPPTTLNTVPIPLTVNAPPRAPRSDLIIQNTRSGPLSPAWLQLPLTTTELPPPTPSEPATVPTRPSPPLPKQRGSSRPPPARRAL